MNRNSNSDALQSMLKECVDRFLSEYRKGTTDFTNFTSIFSRFLQNLPDPPLEIVWFYSALTFHSTKFSFPDSTSSVLVAKNLFQLLVSCSSSCNATKRIAVLAPVIYQLNSLVSEREKWRREAEGLLEVIISYISICCSDNFRLGVEFGDLSCSFTDSVRVWMVERIGESCKFGEELSLFFPLISDGIRNGLISEEREVGYLAGIVMAEVLLLRLCLKFESGISRVDLEKELHGLTVQTMNAFRSFHFVDVLFRILLEPVLSVSSLLNPEDEVLMRKVLYDVAIGECSFPGFCNGVHLPEGSLKNLSIKWLFAAHNGVQFLMEHCEQSKVISYVQAFSESFQLSQLIEWVMNQPSKNQKICKPEVSTPVSFIQWLLILEEEGLSVFDSEILKIFGKSIVSQSRKGYGVFAAESDRKGEEKLDSDLEMVDYEETAVLAADGTKKRKEGMQNEGNKQAKLIKFHVNGHFGMKKGSPSDDEEGLSSGSEVDNPSLDNNIELMEH